MLPDCVCGKIREGSYGMSLLSLSRLRSGVVKEERVGRKGHCAATTTTMCQSPKRLYVVRDKADKLSRESHCLGSFLVHATRSLLLPCVGEEDGGWRRGSVREEEWGGGTWLCLLYADQPTATTPTTLTPSHVHRTPASKASRRRTGSLRHPTRPC